MKYIGVIYQEIKVLLNYQKKRINENNEIDNDDSEDDSENDYEDDSDDDFNPFDKIDKEKLSANPNAIRLLKANPKIINWEGLSENPNAIELLKKNKRKIDWELLSTNPSAIELLKAEPEKIKWGDFYHQIQIQKQQNY